jgi:hypothetical protein
MQETLIPQIHDIESRRALAQAVTAMLQQWEVHPANQASLLGIPDVTPLYQGAPLPDDAEVLEKVGMLMGIGRALYKLFIKNSRDGNRWISKQNLALQGNTPLQVMLANGTEGIKQVRALIERQIP